MLLPVDESCKTDRTKQNLTEEIGGGEGHGNQSLEQRRQDAKWEKSFSRRGAETQGFEDIRKLPSFLIQRTPHRDPRLIEDVGVDHRCGDIGVAEEFLHRPDVIAVLKQMSRKAVPERVGGDRLYQGSPQGGTLHQLLDSPLMKMMPTKDPGVRIPRL